MTRITTARRAAVAAAICSMCLTASVAAQENAAGDGLHAAAPAGALADAAAQAGGAQSGDSAILTFFKDTELSGFVDTYYGYNFNRPGAACTTVGGVAVFNCLRNFDVNHNSFTLSLAELALEKKPAEGSRVGFRFDLDYGPTQALVNAAEPGGSQIFQNIGQAYLGYLAPAGKGLQIDIGKFATPAGFEVIKAKDNWNYSRSLLFALAIPYYHSGVRASYSMNDRFTLTGFLVNGWNNVVDNNTGKTVAVQATVKPMSALAIIETYLGGPEQANDNADWRHVSDTVVTYTVTPELSLAGNYDYGQDKQGGATVKWQGFAGYLRYQPTAWFALSPRAEYYDDTHGFTTGTAQKVKEVTVTGEVKHKDSPVLRLEYRHDFSDLPLFVKKGDENTTRQDTFTVGVIYAFSTKAP